jgi:hypothetical protein
MVAGDRFRPFIVVGAQFGKPGRIVSRRSWWS